MSDQTISNLLYEDRRFEPPADLAARANVTASAYEKAAANREEFWAQAADRLSWARKWDRVLDWDNAPFAKWFVGGQLNVAYNCVDRHVEDDNGDRVAIHWVGEPVGGEAAEHSRDITYAELQAQVCRTANALSQLGVNAGDPVAIYMPMIPEAIFAMLACARLGAPHTVVFGGFSAEALGSRIEDFEAKVVVTADGGYRRGAISPLKPAVDEALRIARCGSDGRTGHEVDRVLVVRRTGHDLGENGWDDSVDVWWHDVVDCSSSKHAAQPFDAEHPLFVMYTSGTTGKPKGIVHTTGGYLTQCAFTHWEVFDLKPESDVYWCTADIGWITGHSYIVYGPLANGATQVLYEGTPRLPRARPLVADHCGQEGHDLLHRPHRDPLLYETRPRGARQARHVFAAHSRLGR